MSRDDSRPFRDPENKRLGAKAQRDGGRPADDPGERAPDRAAAWSPRRGHSGYGMESIRPHLRAQLEQQRLLRPTFPPESEPDEDEPEPRGGRP